MSSNRIFVTQSSNIWNEMGFRLDGHADIRTTINPKEPCTAQAVVGGCCFMTIVRAERCAITSRSFSAELYRHARCCRTKDRVYPRPEQLRIFRPRQTLMKPEGCKTRRRASHARQRLTKCPLMNLVLTHLIPSCTQSNGARPCSRLMPFSACA